jgi:hypothetical protein
MSRKPESVFIQAVHKLLDPRIYRVKMHNPYNAGIPDCFYSATGGDLWVEYKFIPKLPVRVPVDLGLSTLQREWLTERHKEGRNVALIIGHGKDGIVLRAPDFDKELTSYDFREHMVARQYLAEWIAEQTL